MRPSLVHDLLAVGLTGWLVAACWPGRCEGGVRALLPTPSKDQTIAELPRGPANLSLNLDTNAETPEELLATSGLGPRSIVLEGPEGPLPIAVDASIHRTAHSCASRGSLRVTTTAALGPGEYTLVVLMDEIRWPAVGAADVTTWRGRRAVVQRYRVP